MIKPILFFLLIFPLNVWPLAPWKAGNSLPTYHQLSSLAKDFTQTEFVDYLKGQDCPWNVQFFRNDFASQFLGIQDQSMRAKVLNAIEELAMNGHNVAGRASHHLGHYHGLAVRELRISGNTPYRVFYTIPYGQNVVVLKLVLRKNLEKTLKKFTMTSEDKNEIDALLKAFDPQEKQKAPRNQPQAPPVEGNLDDVDLPDLLASTESKAQKQMSTLQRWAKDFAKYEQRFWRFLEEEQIALENQDAVWELIEQCACEKAERMTNDQNRLAFLNWVLPKFWLKENAPQSLVDMHKEFQNLNVQVRTDFRQEEEPQGEENQAEEEEGSVTLSELAKQWEQSQKTEQVALDILNGVREGRKNIVFERFHILNKNPNAQLIELYGQALLSPNAQRHYMSLLDPELLKDPLFWTHFLNSLDGKLLERFQTLTPEAQIDLIHRYQGLALYMPVLVRKHLMFAVQGKLLSILESLLKAQKDPEALVYLIDDLIQLLSGPQKHLNCLKQKGWVFEWVLKILEPLELGEDLFGQVLALKILILDKQVEQVGFSEHFVLSPRQREICTSLCRQWLKVIKQHNGDFVFHGGAFNLVSDLSRFRIISQEEYSKVADPFFTRLQNLLKNCKHYLKDYHLMMMLIEHKDQLFKKSKDTDKILSRKSLPAPKNWQTKLLPRLQKELESLNSVVRVYSGLEKESLSNARFSAQLLKDTEKIGKHLRARIEVFRKTMPRYIDMHRDNIAIFEDLFFKASRDRFRSYKLDAVSKSELENNDSLLVDLAKEIYVFYFHAEKLSHKLLFYNLFLFKSLSGYDFAFAPARKVNFAKDLPKMALRDRYIFMQTSGVCLGALFDQVTPQTRTAQFVKLCLGFPFDRFNKYMLGYSHPTEVISSQCDSLGAAEQLAFKKAEKSEQSVPLMNAFQSLFNAFTHYPFQANLDRFEFVSVAPLGFDFQFVTVLQEEGVDSQYYIGISDEQFSKAFDEQGTLQPEFVYELMLRMHQAQARLNKTEVNMASIQAEVLLDLKSYLDWSLAKYCADRWRPFVEDQALPSGLQREIKAIIKFYEGWEGKVRDKFFQDQSIDPNRLFNDPSLRQRVIGYLTKELQKHFDQLSKKLPEIDVPEGEVLDIDTLWHTLQGLSQSA